MNPKPFSSLNHFTVPVAMWLLSSTDLSVHCVAEEHEATCGRWHYVAGPP
jgi:hypothetical protein